ncbi:conserved hypothetical protein [Culex quinquefasciatus]|uniref:Uncharacterized protein n=1 Tax=Culex quinquefasciatus TaxID=7176 RepID=B0W770_CULQU|nr:uncharacterized protein LOC120415119 [Culex pipiens pallens]XP_039432472.1 uncharacterized protein LOC120415119 [Culex pipiens pallens]EDS37675.1 conserved hypothetical protein [Culex quinquefasciatus]|eukprot:XP_001844554.1 conserved hypothetical protein [Culex quinquefasciatus]
MNSKAALLPLIAILLGALVEYAHGQENVQTRVAPSLIECYNRPELFERDERLPMTMNMLIELIRKVEDVPEYRVDIRQLTIALLHRFRQDGIVRASGVQNIAGVLPFSPSGFHFTKHRILFSRLLPGNALGFPNATLTAQERCALHFMMSSSIDTMIRGDEGQRCSQLSQYRAARVPRELDMKDKSKLRSNYLGDIEMLAQPEMNQIRKQIKKLKQSARLEMGEDEEQAGEDEADLAAVADEEPEAVEDQEQDPEHELSADTSLVDIASNAISACPVENGVVSTRWGTVSAGTVLAGIAAGLEPQSVQLRDLMPRSGQMRSQIRSRQQVQPMRVDNLWAATISGDLAEVTLLHVPSSPNNIQVGAAGAWNHTVSPRWFFLSQRTALEMTDAEIRGGIDGLVLATNIAEWRNRANTLRLSQLLDMYYSERGVFGSPMRSCNRRDQFSTVAPIQTMRDQAAAFSNILDKEMQMAFTVDQNAIIQFSGSAADALASYVPSNLNDPSCEATSITPNDDTVWRTAADLFIYIDMSWPYNDIYSVVGNLLDGVDVGRFGTRYTVLSAQTGEVIVNSTLFLADFHSTFTLALYQTLQSGLNLPNVIRSLREHSVQLMTTERQTASMSGRSKIGLVMPNTAAVSEGDSNWAVQQLAILREEVPDLRMLFFAGGSHTRFNRFVREESRDVFPLRELGSGAVIDAVNVQTLPVIQRIQREPRRIVNPRCGGDWVQADWGSNTINQYVEPQGVVFYRLHPNYFFRAGENRRIRIQGHGFAPLTVCQSRWVQLPRSNATQNMDVINCRVVNSDSVDIDLSNACDGHTVIHSCPPLFFSVEFAVRSQQNGFRCTDNECRFPDMARFAVMADNLGCFSSAGKVISSLVVLFVALVAVFFRQ